jgi:hypothetical protein
MRGELHERRQRWWCKVEVDKARSAVIIFKTGKGKGKTGKGKRGKTGKGKRGKTGRRGRRAFDARLRVPRAETLRRSRLHLLVESKSIALSLQFLLSHVVLSAIVVVTQKNGVEVRVAFKREIDHSGRHCWS